MGDSGSMVAWMPDGRSLLVRDGRPEAGTPYGIFQIDRETSKRTQVTHAPSGIGDSASSGVCPSEGAANRRTSTSLRPDSSETYATQRLSGEN